MNQFGQQAPSSSLSVDYKSVGLTLGRMNDLLNPPLQTLLPINPQPTSGQALQLHHMLIHEFIRSLFVDWQPV